MRWRLMQKVEFCRRSNSLVGNGCTARYRPDGLIDTTFGTNGSIRELYLQPFYGIKIQPDGKILVTGDPGHRQQLQRIPLGFQPDPDVV